MQNYAKIKINSILFCKIDLKTEMAEEEEPQENEGRDNIMDE